ncbi:LysR family transcriptional regulator [Kitasatospora indigofera]|uniref:LysR family transcriptional regulator n=1 Tax=Kitasatospora indigofera TaxID=67307 RepID=UPI0036964955
MHLELRHLRILQAVSDYGSLTRAAAALGVSQPTLTKQVQRIEDELGAPIFSRGRQGAQPTSFGTFVLARTKAALTNVDEILAYRPRAGGLAQIRFGGTMPPWVGGLLDRLSELAPDTHVTVHAERAIGSLVEMVLGRRLDLALVADYPGHLMELKPELACAVVAIEPVFVAVCAQHPLARELYIDLRELAGEAWVVPHSDGMGWPEHLHDECATAGFHPNGRYRLSDTQLRRELVATGRAVTACQASFRGDENVVVKPLKDDPLWMRHLLLWRRDSALAPYGQELVQTAMTAHQQAMRESPAYSGWVRRHSGALPGDDLFHSL